MKFKKDYILFLLLLAIAVLPWLIARVALAGLIIALLLHKTTGSSMPPQADEGFGPRFSRFRHDLLNDLQLVYGFVQLNKPTSDILARVDRVIARIRLAGLMFNIDNWDLSCALFDIWEEAELCGIRLNFQVSGKWSSFSDEWSAWSTGLQAVWAYYKGLAEATGVTEVSLNLKDDPTYWEVHFSAPGAPVAVASLPKRLHFDLGEGARLSWSHVKHSIALRVNKAR